MSSHNIRVLILSQKLSMILFFIFYSDYEWRVTQGISKCVRKRLPCSLSSQSCSFQLKELRKSNAEVFVEMCKSHFQAELDVYIRHNTPIYETLKIVMDQNHREHISKLQVRILNLYFPWLLIYAVLKFIAYLICAMLQFLHTLH